MPQLPIGYNTVETADLDQAPVVISNTPATLFGWHFFNDLASSTLFIRFYNVAAADVTVGTTAHKMIIGIGSLQTVNMDIPGGITFNTAISMAATTAPADADTGAPAAVQLNGTVWFLDSARRQGA